MSVVFTRWNQRRRDRGEPSIWRSSAVVWTGKRWVPPCLLPKMRYALMDTFPASKQVWKELVRSSILKRHLDHTGMENDDNSLFLLSLRFLHWPPFEISNYFGIQIETIWIILFVLIARASIIVGTTIRNMRWFWYIDWYLLYSVDWFCHFI